MTIIEPFPSNRPVQSIDWATIAFAIVLLLILVSNCSAHRC